MDSSLAVLLINSGLAGVFVLLMILGLVVPRTAVDKLEKRYQDYADRQEATISRLQAALDLERQSGRELRDAGGLTNQLIGALVDVAVRHGPRP